MSQLLPLTALLLILAGCGGSPSKAGSAEVRFDGGLALEAVRAQLAFGPRVPGTEGHAGCAQWMIDEFSRYADSVAADRWDHVTAAGDSLPLINITASFNPSERKRVLLCAHWDTRPVADQDPDPAKRGSPIPGANDGGSGTAVLLELAHVFAANPPGVGVDLVLFDGEDYGDFNAGTDVLLGSLRFAAHNRRYRPRLGILLDMVGDADAEFPYEGYSWQWLNRDVELVWDTAHELGYGNYFVRQQGTHVIDDHVPLFKAGIHCIDVIQMGLPYWHTHGDDIDKLSAATLEAVGRTVAEVVRSFAE
ncbi:MAG: M28 family peptidase [Candidatus Glassbacteria bacterium]|nr:M28 family peptidase [Candidatus Glassbacteria bacterium]